VVATTTRTVLSAPVETRDRVWIGDLSDTLILYRMRCTSRSRRWEDHLLRSRHRRLGKGAEPLPTTTWSSGCATVIRSDVRLSPLGGEHSLSMLRVSVLHSLGAQVPRPL
jgi:hypothetical protein